MYSLVQRGASRLVGNSRRLFSGGHGPIPQKLGKVADKIIWINVKNTYGAFQRVPAFAGESLMYSLLRANTEGFDAQCRGGDPTYLPHERPLDPLHQGLFCSSCQVIIDKPWFHRMTQEIGPPSQYEQSIIDTTDVPNAQTRLACCIPVEHWMNQMTIRVVEVNEIDEKV